MCTPARERAATRKRGSRSGFNTDRLLLANTCHLKVTAYIGATSVRTPDKRASICHEMPFDKMNFWMLKEHVRDACCLNRMQEGAKKKKQCHWFMRRSEVLNDDCKSLQAIRNRVRLVGAGAIGVHNTPWAEIQKQPEAVPWQHLL